MAAIGQDGPGGAGGAGTAERSEQGKWLNTGPVKHAPPTEEERVTTRYRHPLHHEEPSDYSAIISPEPPNSAGKSFNFGKPSRIGSTASE